ncbi:SMP-30/gluconolactonase/LRE family protein [Pyxidicoccus sp. 3LG]
MPLTARTRADLARTRWREALAASREGLLEKAHALAAEAHAAWPTQAAYAYGLAALSARLGDAAATAHWLDVSAALGLGTDIARDASFSRVLATATVRDAAERLARNLEPRARSTLAFRLREEDFFPEGIACEATGETCYVASVKHRKVVRVGRDGRSTEVVPPGQDGVLAALAVAVSLDERTLWVTSAAIPQMQGFAKGDENLANVHAFDLPSGRLQRRLGFPAGTGPHAPGDIHVTSNGEVFVSDSQHPVLYRVPPTGDTLEVFASDPLFRSPQGVAESADGRTLYVADYSHGILAVDRASRKVSEVTPPIGAATVLGIDGLVRHEDSLIGIQNGLQPARVIRMRLDTSPLRIQSVELLDRHLPEADQPTIGAVVGDALLYVANSQWEQYDDEGRLREGAALTPPLILRLPLREGSR